ncbi:lipid-A-disaccharide synthase [Thioalkalicoccus limnaeus]|uniref:Lipid-A-disaccharide synthase n=1 Tax=Thioalkalicoccus limnaeus TaxID=120681 RepID=A0ABV4BB00_9GAMM
MTTIGIVANEPSGDQLGAALIRALRDRRPDLTFIGVAGPRMQQAGCATLVDIERLSVMGLTEVLGHLPALLRIRRELVRHFLTERPALFIGIDAPDFNLGLERRLRDAGLPTVHMVCPTVWAWRPRRVETIRRAADLVLSLFPFEQTFLQRHRVPARYVGHPLADQIPAHSDREACRTALGLGGAGPWIAILPGSRRGEVARLAEPFIATARWCLARRPTLRFVVPLVNARVRDAFAATLGRVAPDLPIELIDGHGREAMAASDLVLTASGTATLEALLLKRPMVVAYRIHPLTYQLLKRLHLIKVPHIAMANLLAGEALAPEFLQDQCRPETLGPALLSLLDDPRRVAAIQQRYAAIHDELRRDAAATAADAVLALLAERAVDA